jgi:hypothetical protein
MVIDKMLVDQMEVAFMASSLDDDLALLLNCLIPVSLLESNQQILKTIFGVEKW